MAAVPPGQNRAVPSQDPPPQHVTYVGFATPFRREVIGFLVKRGIPIRVHGKGWLDVGQTDAPVKGKMFKLVNDIRYYGLPRLIVEGPSFIAQKTASWTKNRSAKPAGFLPTQATGGSIPSEDLGAFYRNSAINLGIDGWDFEKSSRRDWGQVRLRDFEIPMAGGFFLAQAVPELDLHYDLDKEIAVWHNLDELEAKISYFLNNPQEAETIRENGHLRALRDHKWENRWDCLFGNLSAIERS
jgi:spore maturation protein CgeB